MHACVYVQRYACTAVFKKVPLFSLFAECDVKYTVHGRLEKGCDRSINKIRYGAIVNTHVMQINGLLTENIKYRIFNTKYRIYIIQQTTHTMLLLQQA